MATEAPAFLITPQKVATPGQNDHHFGISAASVLWLDRRIKAFGSRVEYTEYQMGRMREVQPHLYDFLLDRSIIKDAGWLYWHGGTVGFDVVTLELWQRQVIPQPVALTDIVDFQQAVMETTEDRRWLLSKSWAKLASQAGLSPTRCIDSFINRLRLPLPDFINYLADFYTQLRREDQEQFTSGLVDIAFPMFAQMDRREVN